MQLPKLTRGKILRRYKRFLAEVELENGELVTAHCPNTGSMRSCWAPGAPVELSYHEDPRRKLAWTLERVDMGAGWVGVHTGRTNGVMAEAIVEGRIPPLAGYGTLRREVRFELEGHPRSRLDLQLSDGSAPDALVEVKNVTLLEGDRIRFPDAVSERARKHLDVLAGARAQGWRAVMLFAVNRPEGRVFAPATVDPAYSERLREVARSGVEVLAVRIEHGPDWMRAGPLVAVELEG